MNKIMLYTAAALILTTSCVKQSDYDAVVNELHEARVELAETQQNLDEAKNSITDLEIRVEDLIVIVGEKNQALMAIDNQLEQARGAIENLQVALNLARDQKRIAESEVARLNTEVDRLYSLYINAVETSLNPGDAEEWLVERYPYIAFDPGNLDAYRIAWLQDAEEQGFVSQYAIQNGKTLEEVSLIFRGEYGSKLDPLFDGDRTNGEAGGYAYYGTLRHFEQYGHNSNYASWYAHPRYSADGAVDVHYMIRMTYHEMGHAYFNYKHPTNENGTVTRGHNGHDDIMGYYTTTRSEDEWNAQVARYFNEETQEQYTGATHLKVDEHELIACNIE